MTFSHSTANLQRERAKRQEELELLKKGREAVAVGILDWQGGKLNCNVP